MSWKKSVRNGNFSPHEEEKNCFFAAFSFYFPVFRRQEFTGRMLAVPSRRFHRKKKEAEDGRFPFAFVLWKSFQAVFLIFSGVVCVAYLSSRPHREANGRFSKAWDWRFDRLCRKSTLFFFLCALGRFLRIDYLCLCEWRGSRSREQSRDVTPSEFIIECKWK